MNLLNPKVETTAGVWPNSQQLKDYLSIPLALSLHPLAHDPPTGSLLPPQITAYRCQSCKAFINQLCFIRNDHEYDCSICGCTNYLQKEIDILMPELNNMSYRLQAPSSQRLLTTAERLFVFLLDLSNYSHQSSQYLLYSLHVIRQFLKRSHADGLPFKIIIMGFDCGLIRYVLNPGQGLTIRKIVTNNDEQEDQDYLPEPIHLMGNVSQHYQNLLSVLNDIEKNIIDNRLRSGHSRSIMNAIQKCLKASQGYSGKIFLVSGLRAELPNFYNNLKRYFLDVHQRHSFLVNKKQCIPESLELHLQSTQMSLWAAFINNYYMNSMPFHVITKQLNGQLRHFFPSQLTLFFHQFKGALEQILDQGTGFEALLRVRYSVGLKMVGVFGAFRSTKIQDQVELLSCPSNRQYLFEFILQSRIFTEFVVVQFSTLYTNARGQRYFVIDTHMNKVSSNLQDIVASIDYTNINISYVRGIVHNLDMSFKLRNLQLILQERCKKHLQAVRMAAKSRIRQENQDEDQCQWLSRAKPYVVLTFLMMKHFLLNQVYHSQINHDLNAQMRSKVATMDDFINLIWPIVYAVREDGWEVIEMKEKNLPRATQAVFIDRCDHHYVYLADVNLQGQLRTGNGKERLQQLVKIEPRLKQLRLLVEDLKERKGLAYIDLIPLQEISELKILDLEGQFGYDKFINELVQN